MFTYYAINIILLIVLLFFFGQQKKIAGEGKEPLNKNTRYKQTQFGTLIICIHVLIVFLYSGTAYITSQLPGFHGVHGPLIDAFIVALHIAGVLLFVLVLLKIQRDEEKSVCRALLQPHMFLS